MVKDIRCLTGLRGLAAIYVCVYHLLMENSSLLVQHGYLAVDLFFVLSGFVIALSYHEMFAAGVTRASFTSFMIRRLARIYPLYLVVTCLFMALMALGWQEPGQNLPLGRTLILNVFLIQAWALGGSLAFVTWSISTEWAAYLLFPFVIGFVLRQGSRATAASAAFALSCVVYICYSPTPSAADYRSGPLDCSWVYSMLPVLRCCSEFHLGLVTFWLYRRTAVSSIARRAELPPILCLAIVVLLTRHGTDWIVAMLFPALVFVLAVGRGPAQALLGSRPLYGLGELSYAIYLLHLLSFKAQSSAVQGELNQFQIAVARGLHVSIPHFPVKLTIAVALFGAAVFAHLAIERPCRTLIRRLERFTVPTAARRTIGAQPVLLEALTKTHDASSRGR